MDILYTLRRKHIASNKSLNDFDCLHEGTSLCTVSVKNTIAFSTRTELEDTTGKSYGSHIYVADLNTPWHSYKVTTSTNGTVTALEWDSCGEKLLIATNCGSVSIWASRDHVLNSWSCLGGTTFPGETIIAAAFFHTGRKISIVAEKKDSPIYSDKMSHIKFSPSVRCFGGYGAEGCLLITGTGIAGALSLDREGRIYTKSKSLATTRAALSVADIAHGKNGDFVVAVSNSDVCRVQCNRVSVSLIEERLHIKSEALPSFFVHSFNLNKHHPCKISGLKFITREDADSLVVSANTQSGGVVEIWQLTERVVPVHRVFKQPNELSKIVAWQYECSHTTSHSVTSVTTNKIALTTAVPPPSYVLIATSDSSVHCLYRDNLKLVGSRSLACAWLEDTVKHQRLDTKITHMDLTWLGCALVTVDSHGQLYLFKVPPILEPGVGMTVNIASALLDYCLVSGTDAWDVLVSLQSSIVDAIVDRITDNFSKQPQAVQQYYYTAHLQMKMALARLTANGQNKAVELNSLLMLNAVSTAFTSLLRPSDMTSHEKGPADSVACLLSENQITDIDKVLFHLECKEFTMEPSTLQSLQQLIQWTADLALNILARLPEHYKSPFIDFLRDIKAINCLRSLLVIIRVWGLLRSTCLPLFVKSAENVDVLSVLFKLLSKLAQSHEPDETLIDECCHLPSQVMIPQMSPSTPLVFIASPLLPYQSFPIQLEYSIDPDCLMYEPETSQIEGCLATDQSLDTIRHLYLGKQPLLVKQCCRVLQKFCIVTTERPRRLQVTACSDISMPAYYLPATHLWAQLFISSEILKYALWHRGHVVSCGGKTQVSQVSTPHRTAAIRAWDQRWLRSCRCGGQWRIHKFS